MTPELLDDITYLTKKWASFTWDNFRKTLSIKWYWDFREFVDSHLTSEIVESNKTEVDWKLESLTLTYQKKENKVYCLLTWDEVAEYLEEKALKDTHFNEIKKDEMEAEAEYERADYELTNQD